jgi:hypothetical protein
MESAAPSMTWSGGFAARASYRCGAKPIRPCRERVPMARDVGSGMHWTRICLVCCLPFGNMNPCFVDCRRSLDSHSLVSGLKGAVRTVFGWDSRDIEFLKTGLDV